VLHTGAGSLVVRKEWMRVYVTYSFSWYYDLVSSFLATGEVLFFDERLDDISVG